MLVPTPPLVSALARVCGAVSRAGTYAGVCAEVIALALAAVVQEGQKGRRKLGKVNAVPPTMSAAAAIAVGLRLAESWATFAKSFLHYARKSGLVLG